MTFLPIVKRELAVLAARAGARWVRIGLIGVAIFFCLQFFALRTGMSPTSAGAAAFHTLAGMAFLLACGATFVTADCVSYERRDGTLGLLFLTDLKGHDVVLGKLVAAGLNAFYALLGMAPVLMLPLLAGGVTGLQVFWTALALLNLLLIALAVGMVATVRATTRARAWRDAALLFVFVLAWPWLPNLAWESDLSSALKSLSPLYVIVNKFDMMPALKLKSIWISFALVHAEAWLLLLLAAFLLQRGWRDSFNLRRVKSGHEARRERHAHAATPPTQRPAHVFRPIAPVAYSFLRLRSQGALAWGAAVISFLGSFGSAAGVMGLGMPSLYFGVPAILHFGSSGLFAWVAGRFLFEARRSGELELLLSTPVGARGIVRDQWFALMRVLRGPLILVVIGALPHAARVIAMGAGTEMIGLLGALLTMANAVLGVFAMTWFGMWLGARVKRPIAIVGWAVGLVDVSAIVISYVVVFVIANLASPRGFTYPMLLWSVALPFLFTLKNVGFIWWSHQQLCREFRTPGVLRWTNWPASWTGADSGGVNT
ncbi:MAG: hypothetical protein EPO07_15630 [Verrucomicrobia bacterium]|nr:MAG: hypothetical protein EPO07_15630 [Verrucomicrobiota bacterium]